MPKRCKRCNSLIHLKDEDYCSRCRSEFKPVTKLPIKKPKQDNPKQDNTTQMWLAITTYNMLMNTVFK